MCPCNVTRAESDESRKRRGEDGDGTVIEHGARYERRGVVMRRASVIVGTRESDEIGDDDGGKGYSRG